MSRSRRDDARVAGIIDRIRDIPKGSVQAYSDIDPAAPRLVGRVLATTHEDLPWHRVVRADGSIPKGRRQRDLTVWAKPYAVPRAWRWAGDDRLP